MDTFPKRLKAAREARRMTQLDVARSLDIHESQVARYERGPFKPKEERLYRFARVLGVTPSWLMFGVGDGPAAREVA